MQRLRTTITNYKMIYDCTRWLRLNIMKFWILLIFFMLLNFLLLLSNSFSIEKCHRRDFLEFVFLRNILK